MRRTLGTILLVSLLAGPLFGCGSDETASDPATTSSSPTGSTSAGLPDGPVDSTLVELVSQTAAGGKVSERATVLAETADVADFVEQFKTGKLGGELMAAAEGAEVAQGQELVGAVVALGCDVPPGVSVQAVDGVLTITPLKVKSPLQECFAPVTTVALVSVDASLV